MSYEQMKDEYTKMALAANNLIGMITEFEQGYGEDEDRPLMGLDIRELRDQICQNLGKLDLFMENGSGRWETRDEFNKRLGFENDKDQLSERKGSTDA